MNSKISERRYGTHKAVHRLAQVYADLVISIGEIEGLPADFQFQDRKHRALCLIRNSRDVIQHVVDTDLGVKLAEKE